MLNLKRFCFNVSLRTGGKLPNLNEFIFGMQIAILYSFCELFKCQLKIFFPKYRLKISKWAIYICFSSYILLDILGYVRLLLILKNIINFRTCRVIQS